MSPKTELIQLGIKNNEIDHHESDLYVIKNEVSSAWVTQYQFKENVEIFTSELDGQKWFDIPFAYY